MICRALPPIPYPTVKYTKREAGIVIDAASALSSGHLAKRNHEAAVDQKMQRFRTKVQSGKVSFSSRILSDRVGFYADIWMTQNVRSEIPRMEHRPCALESPLDSNAGGCDGLGMRPM